MASIKVKGRLKDLSFDRDGRQLITLAVTSDVRGEFDALAQDEIDVEIKKHKEQRSLSANAYFHVLVNAIARSQGTSDDDVKKILVCRYGALLRDDDGGTVGFKLPASVDASLIYPYVRCFDTRYEDGKEFKCYLAYKRTRYMDSGEMARLIDGAVSEAKEIGINTDTPEQIEKLKALWAEEERKN
jgi:hypothetical protein